MAGLVPCANICSRAALNFGKAGMRKLGTDKKMNMMMVRMVMMVIKHISNLVIERQNFEYCVPLSQKKLFPHAVSYFICKGKRDKLERLSRFFFGSYCTLQKRIGALNDKDSPYSSL